MIYIEGYSRLLKDEVSRLGYMEESGYNHKAILVGASLNIIDKSIAREKVARFMEKEYSQEKIEFLEILAERIASTPSFDALERGITNNV